MTDRDFVHQLQGVYIRGLIRNHTRILRRRHVEVIQEMVDGIEKCESNARLWKKRAIESEAKVSDLLTRVKDFERLISARDRFGCWVCSKHEQESMRYPAWAS
jgi:hypothetical protein